MTAAQAPAQAVEVCFRVRNSRRQAFARIQGETNWRKWSVPRADEAIRRNSIKFGDLVDAPVVVRASLED